MKFLDKNTIKLDKELNELDKITIEFTSILNKLKINYTIISGYVAVVFGRNRASEDIDLFIERVSEKVFLDLWKELAKEFECINNEEPLEVFKDYLKEGSAVRFARKGKFIPNIELKFPKTDIDFWGIHNKKKLVLNNNEMYISPLESQIPFKLFMGSEKDIEDAKYLYNIFKDNLDKSLLEQFIRNLNIGNKFKAYLK